MQQFGPLVTNPWAVWVVGSALILWAAGSATSLWRGTEALIRALWSARERIEETPDARAFAERYEALSASLATAPILGPRWREWQESLVLPRDPGRLVRSTTRPRSWFDLDLLRADGVRIDARYHAALPNLLVGAGLLFTFLGLAVALSSASGIVADGVNQVSRNQALHNLLDTASFKFVTSLVGLLLSIVYALFRKRRLQAVERALGRFLAAVEQRVPLLTPAALQQEANEFLRKQTMQLETFSTELAVNIGTAFDNSFDKRLGEHIAPLTDAIQRLAGGMSSRNEDAIRSMMEAFLDRLQVGAGDKMQEAVASLAGLGQRLEGLQTSLGEAAVRMSQAADAMATRMGEGAEAALARITSQLGGLAETLRGLADSTRNAGSEAGQAMALKIEAAAAGFEAAARSVAATLAEAGERMERRMGEEASASSARLSSQFEAMLGELRGLAESSRAAGTSALDAVAQRIGEAAAGFEATAARVAETLDRAAGQTGGTLGRGAEEAVARIASATEAMRGEMNAAFAELREAVGSAGAALRDGSAAGAATLGTAMSGVGEALDSASQQLRQAGGDAADALRRGGDAAGGRLDGAGNALGTQAGALGRQIAALGSAADSLVLRAEELGRAARDATTPLTTTATTLSGASEGLVSAIQPLRAVAQDMTRVVEQISGAAQRAELANAGATRLIDTLDAAAKRFESVDRALATTISGLQAGLLGFTQQISTFVAGTDQNLAKAATQLGNLVKSLDDTLEDFRPNGGARA